jgi:ADP-ribose pyrophosphatase YjhB (NUDIX family)
MQHRISAGAIVLREGKVLLVRHCLPGAYDFWVLPGGGVMEGEDAAAAARREVLEEAGLEVETLHLAYIEETQLDDMRECKLWFLCKEHGGELSTAAHEATREHIVGAAFFAREELEGTVAFPPFLFTDAFWNQATHGFAQVEYLGLRQREF